jgi:hypothetical protein
LLFAQATETPVLISYELVKTYTKETLQQRWKEQGVPEVIAPVRYNIDVYELIYRTKWHDGSTIQASGLYFVPRDSTKDESMPMVCYHHGTQIKKERKVRLGGEQAICVGFAADGYLVARPDYIGLGKGERRHLYHHVPTQSGASMDMLRAIKELNLKIKVSQNDLLFATGYSQGGHATMGFHKTVQEQYSEEFKITASAPMSGAYDLAGVQEETMFKEYSHPGYLPYLFFSFQEVYGFYDNGAKIFEPPYDTILPPLYKGEHSMGYINRLIPSIPIEVLRPEIIAEYLAKDDFPFKKALRENSVHDWKPERPVLICYCQADEQVTYKNALVAYDKMKANGSAFVRIKHVNKHLGHKDCAMFAVMHTKMFFDSFRKGSKKGTAGPLGKRFLIGIGKSSVAKKAKKRRRLKAKALAAEKAEEKLNEKKNVQNYKLGYELGYKCIQKGRKLIDNKRNLNQAIKYLDLAKKCNYGFCGNAWAGAFSAIHNLKSQAYVLKKEYKKGLAELDSISGCGYGANCGFSDSLKLELLFLIHGKEIVQEQVLEKADSILFKADEFFFYDEFVCLYLEALNYTFCFSNVYAYSFGKEQVSILELLKETTFYDRLRAN